MTGANEAMAYLEKSPSLHRPHKHLKRVVRSSTDHLSTGVKGQAGKLNRSGGGKCSEIAIPEFWGGGGGGGGKRETSIVLISYRYV